MQEGRLQMTQNRMALALELADIRAEIARLKQREAALASMEHRFPLIPVFRRGWPMQRASLANGDGAHA
jgi:hypothetical protein